MKRFSKNVLFVLGALALLCVVCLFMLNSEGFTTLAAVTGSYPIAAPHSDIPYGVRSDLDATAKALCVPQSGALLGYPSNDNQFRLYTPADCATLGGTSYADGECIKSTGTHTGNLTTNCAGLNPRPPAPPPCPAPTPITAAACASVVKCSVTPMSMWQSIQPSLSTAAMTFANQPVTTGSLIPV